MFGKKVLLLSLCTSLMAGCGAFATQKLTAQDGQRAFLAYSKNGTPFDVNKLDNSDFARGFANAERQSRGLGQMPYAEVLQGKAVPTAKSIYQNMEEAKRFKQPPRPEQNRPSDDYRGAHQNYQDHPSNENETEIDDLFKREDPSQTNVKAMTESTKKLANSLLSKIENSQFKDYASNLRQAILGQNFEDVLSKLYKALDAKTTITPLMKTQVVALLGLTKDAIGFVGSDEEYADFVNYVFNLLEESHKKTASLGKLAIRSSLAALSLAAIIAGVRYGLFEKIGSKLSSLFKQPEPPKGFFASTWDAIHEAMSSIYSGVFGK